MDKNILQKKLQRLLTGKSSTEEIREINNWYDSFDKDERLILEDHQNRKREEIKNQLFDNIQKKSKIESKRKAKLRYMITFAVAACLCIGLFTLVWKTTHQSSSFPTAESFISFENGVGMIKKVKLPDGSMVHLHHHASIEVTKNFSSHRHVILKGKAFFDVQPNQKLPFTIQTESFLTTVLGTSFSIDNSPQSMGKVAVKTGNVKVTSSDYGEVLLGAMESVELKQDQLIQATIKNSDVEFGWTDKTIAFENTEIKKMIAQIENWYGVTISTNCETLPNKKISGVYKDMSLEELLMTIQFTLPFNYQIHEKNIQIDFQQCN